MYKVLYKKTFEKDLRKIPDKIRKQIVKAIYSLSNDPRQSGVKKLRANDSLYRYRTGNYRIIYQIQDKELIIMFIATGHRKDIYENI